MSTKAERLAEDMESKGAGLSEIIATLARVLSSKESADWLDQHMEKKRRKHERKSTEQQ